MDLRCSSSRGSRAWLALFLLLGFGARDAALASEKTVAVRAGRIYTADPSSEAEEVIHDGVLLIDDGKIVAVGANLEIPPFTRVLDFSDGVIIPGLVAATTGLLGDNKTAPESVGAHYRAADGFDPFHESRPTLGGGVTTLHLSPGRNRLLSGQGAVVKVGTGGSSDAVLRETADLCVHLTAEALNPPYLVDIPIPSSWDQEIKPGEPQMPRSRMGMLLEIDRWIERARQDGEAESRPRRASLRALRDAIANRVPFRIEARSAADLARAVAWLERTGFRGYLARADEVHEVLDQVAAAGRAVVLEVPGAFSVKPRDIGPRDDPIEARASTAIRLAEHKIPFALAPPPGAHPSELMLHAGLAVAEGLARADALRAVTRTPARILGVLDRVGSLEPGKDADFVVLSGEPFESRTSVRRVFVDGKVAYSPSSGSGATVIQAETLLVGDGDEIRDGEVLIEKGKIVAVGRTVPHPPGARVIRGGPGSHLAPGFIDAHGHLGLGGDRSSPSSAVPIWRTVGVPRQDSLRAASAGVTSVLLAPYGAHAQGSQMALIKTGGSSREVLVARPLAGLKFVVPEKDPLEATGGLANALKAGKAYFDTWKKYEADLKKWEEEQEKKKAEEGQKKEAEARPEKTVVEEETQQVADPISGKWSFTLSGGPIPQPQEGTMYLQLEDGVVNGKMQTPFGDEAEASGTFDGKKLVLEIDMSTPAGAPTLTAELDREDHLIGKLSVGPIAIDFEANRVEADVAEIKISVKKKGKGKDGRPTPPTVKKNLEPFRDLFAGKIAALVQVDHAPEIRAALELFSKTYKVGVVVLGGWDANRAVESLGEAKSGVVLPTEIVAMRRDRPYLAGDVLTRAGLPVAFQSDAEDGARTLRTRAVYAVSRGMDPTEALKALTVYPARLFKIEDRVGSLAPGRDGDVVLYSGHPLEATSRVRTVLINGEEVQRP